MDDKLKSLIESLKFVLGKKAVVFDTGGIKPTNELGESWIGKVCWKRADEKQPIGKNGTPMFPIATIFVEDSEYTPKALKNVRLITIYMDFEFWNNLGAEDYKDFFVINVYNDFDQLVQCNYTSDEITPFPLVPKRVDDEFPLSDEIEYISEAYDDIISDYEEKGVWDYYEDIFGQNNSKHKIGGYPCHIQGPVGYDDGYEFVLQISSDEKAGMNIVEGGNFYFGYNPEKNDWSVRCDFY